jgi:hypothetical protein
MEETSGRLRRLHLRGESPSTSLRYAQDERFSRTKRRSACLDASSPLGHGRMFRFHGQTLPGWLPRQKTPFVLSVGGAAAEVEGRFLPETIIDPPSDREGMDDDPG